MMHHVTTRLCLQCLTPDDLSALQKPDKGYKEEWVSALMAVCVVHTTKLQGCKWGGASASTTSTDLASKL